MFFLLSSCDKNEFVPRNVQKFSHRSRIWEKWIPYGFKMKKIIVKLMFSMVFLGSLSAEDDLFVPIIKGEMFFKKYLY